MERRFAKERIGITRVRLKKYHTIMMIKYPFDIVDNHITAKLYEDMGMFTCDEEIGADATELFNYLTGYASLKEFRRLLVAPINMRERLNELIEREIAHQSDGKQGYLIFKVNALVDKPMIKLLYKASQAGVKIDLIVRSMCSLRPGVEGLSETINVVSILGRFLEHSRIFYFHNAGDEEIVMGSADLMPRNLNERVEVLFPVQDRKIIRNIRDNILESYLSDNNKARIMKQKGTYVFRTPPDGEPLLTAQERFLSKE